MDNRQKGTVAVSQAETAIRAKIENFITLINKQPPVNKIRKNQYANNSNYLPIGFYELELDRLFLGHWQSVHIGGSKTIGNAIVCDIEVQFLHPVTGQWLKRAGTGAIPVQTNKDGSLQDKALVKAAPAAKAEAFKNAVKSIGKLFGRDLNRDTIMEEYERFYTPLNK